MKQLSIIIVTYNSCNLIFDCLKSIFDNNDLKENLEVIVIDNNSSDFSRMSKEISKTYYEKVICVNSQNNGGYGFGNNIGMRISHAPITIVMNPDVRIIDKKLSCFIKPFNDKLLGLYGVCFVDGSLPFYLKPGCGNFLFELFWKYSSKFLRYNPNTMFVSGSFLVFRKEAFSSAGQFDENIFMYHEEADIINRIMACGYKVKLMTDISVLHLAHGRKFNEFLEKERLKSELYYLKKYNIDYKQTLKSQKNILKLKIFVAKMLNKNKESLFVNQLNLLSDVINEID